MCRHNNCTLVTSPVRVVVGHEDLYLRYRGDLVFLPQGLRPDTPPEISLDSF